MTGYHVEGIGYDFVPTVLERKVGTVCMRLQLFTTNNKICILYVISLHRLIYNTPSSFGYNTPSSFGLKYPFIVLVKIPLHPLVYNTPSSLGL